MIKTHIYTKNHTYTVKEPGAIEFTILRQNSVTDGTFQVKPKGRQLVMFEVTESDGKLLITNKATGQSVLF